MEANAIYDVLIIGSGASGLSLALNVADKARVAVISKGDLTESSTYYAQGGISAVLDDNDSFQSHIEDTCSAGAGLCNREIVEKVVRESQVCIQDLINKGVKFTQNDNAATFHLTREGGHSHRRVIHAADATGRAVETTLADHVKNHPNIDIFEHHIAVDLITGSRLELDNNRCYGAYVLNRQENRIIVFSTRFVVLATGGANKVYLYTSNPDVSTGDGIAIGWRAGCRVGNMEFIQFHPTCLYHPEAKSFLVSEALRGEGAKLLLPDGSRFMQHFDKRAELAPRDTVARAIDHEMKRLGIDCVYLDISHKPAEFIKTHFPNIYERCLSFGFDLTTGPIPVVPAAHYTCGGLIVDPKARTDLPGLYAIGETAFTGLHGANRMASNSLLECLTFAKFAADDILELLQTPTTVLELPEWDESRVTPSDEDVVISHNWDELRRFMWDYVGIVRSNKRLESAKRRVELLRHEIRHYYGNFRINNDLLELRNLITVAELIIRCAIKRKESRGLHYTLDYPKKRNTAINTTLTPENYVPEPFA